MFNLPIISKVTIFNFIYENQMEENSIKEKLIKILELVQRGEAGEQDNARVLLDRLLLEHNLTLNDLLHNEKTALSKFDYTDNYEKKLILQIIAKVTNRDSFKIVYRGNKAWTNLTRLQEEEVKDQFKIYLKAWQEESDIFFSAFVQKNGIFPDALSEVGTLDDFDSLSRLVNMMRSVNKVDLARQNNLLTKDLF